MFITPQIAPHAMNMLRTVWDNPDLPDYTKVQGLWGLLNGLQGLAVGQLLFQRLGDRVFAGPFRGMALSKEILSLRPAPVLLGTYEWELHGALDEAIAKSYQNVVNIGCADGYYSVGLALRMPHAKIYAHDIDEAAQKSCRAMAALNGVADRVIVGGVFNGEDFAKFAGEETLVFMDIEGAERELLDPAAYPALAGMDVIVELHDCDIAGLSTAIPSRFAATHDVRVIPNMPFNFPLEKVLGPDYVPDHFDNLIATWEGRAGPTPFGVFKRKTAA